MAFIIALSAPDHVRDASISIPLSSLTVEQLLPLLRRIVCDCHTLAPKLHQVDRSDGLVQCSSEHDFLLPDGCGEIVPHTLEIDNVVFCLSLIHISEPT